MTPVMLAMGAAALAFIAGLASADRAWRAAAGLLVALVAAGIWFTAPPAGEIGGPIYAEARDGAGVPVSAVVVLQREGGNRQIRRVALRAELAGGALALGLGIALGLLGAALQTRDRSARIGAGLAFAGAVAAAVPLAGARQTGAGEAGVRAFLERFDVGPLQSFSVPDGAWTYAAPGLLPAAIAAIIAGIALLIALLRPRLPDFRPGLALGAALAAGAAAWRLAMVGGLPWRPVEGALWGTAVLLVLAAVERRSPLRAALLTAAGLALATLAASA